MVEKIRQHRTEIIIAIITALAGLSVAVIGNWDKITGNQLKNLENNIPELTYENMGDYINEDYYSLLLQGYIDTKQYTKDGWQFEHFHYATAKRDSMTVFDFKFVTGYTYKFVVYSLDEEIECEIKLIPSDRAYSITKFEVDLSFAMDIITSTDLDKYFIVKVIGGQKFTGYALLIISRKT